MADNDNPKEEPKVKGEKCWNCLNQDPDTKNVLDSKGNCKVCGFKKSKLYNGGIEAEKAEARNKAAQETAFNNGVISKG